MQLIWAENDQKSLRAFAVLLLFVLTATSLAIMPGVVSNEHAIFWGALASIFALWSWWIANAKHRDLLDPDAPIGGEGTTGELPGNLGGFTY